MPGDTPVAGISRRIGSKHSVLISAGAKVAAGQASGEPLDSGALLRRGLASLLGPARHPLDVRIGLPATCLSTLARRRLASLGYSVSYLARIEADLNSQF